MSGLQRCSATVHGRVQLHVRSDTSLQWEHRVVVPDSCVYRGAAAPQPACAWQPRASATPQGREPGSRLESRHHRSLARHAAHGHAPLACGGNHRQLQALGKTLQHRRRATPSMSTAGILSLPQEISLNTSLVFLLKLISERGPGWDGPRRSRLAAGGEAGLTQDHPGSDAKDEPGSAASLSKASPGARGGLHRPARCPWQSGSPTARLGGSEPPQSSHLP